MRSFGERIGGLSPVVNLVIGPGESLIRNQNPHITVFALFLTDWISSSFIRLIAAGVVNRPGARQRPRVLPLTLAYMDVAYPEVIFRPQMTADQQYFLNLALMAKGPWFLRSR